MTAHTSAAQSRRAKSGNAAEGSVESLNDICKLHGVAALDKVPTSLRVVGRTARGVIAVYDKKSIVDYVGTMAGGRSVRVEAKHVSVELSKRTGLPLPCALSLTSRLEPQQREHLDLTHKLGGLSVLLILHGTIAVYACPWVEVRELAVVRDGALEAWRVPRGVPYLRVADGSQNGESA